jgi:hypothetical protein
MIRFKSDVHHVFLEFQAHVECLLNRKIISVQSDWGGEYQCLNSYLKYVGIQHHISCPHTHQQNGVAECKHRHIVETGLALLAHSSLPLQFLDEAFITVCYLINQLPSKSLRLVTPFEHLLAKQPSYDQLRVFSSRCWPNLRPYNSMKLSFRSMSCVFLGCIACTRVISVTMFPLGTYIYHVMSSIYHVMSSLMKTCSHLPTTSLHCQNISLKLPFFQRCILPHTLHLTGTLNRLFYPLCMMTLILLYHASILL